MVIISSINPDNLALNAEIKYKYNHYIIYKSNLSEYFAHILKPDDVKVWKNCVRNFIDQDHNQILFIGKGANPQQNEAAGCIVTGQVNLSGKNPLIGKNDNKYGPRFFDVTDLYSKELRENLFTTGEDLISGNILIPHNVENLSELEQKVLDMEDINFAGITKDIFAGALTAKHAGAESAGLLIFHVEYDLEKVVSLGK